MKISICIPQYNRIDYLLVSLNKIQQQTYQDIEICISDDASEDNTEIELKKFQPKSKYPILYNRFNENVGYDRNLRKSLEMASGDYCFILGNDDTLHKEDDIEFLVNWLQANNLPEIGFCNSADYINTNDVSQRARSSTVVGSGESITLKYYSSFSFVAGLIFKRESFERVNTNRFDNSIYVQIYLACMIMINGGKLFTIQRPMVLKDIRVEGNIANSYKDTLPRKWKDFQLIDAGLPSYANVVVSAFEDAGYEKKKYAYKVISRIYKFTYPFWLIDYRINDAFVAAWGIRSGLHPAKFKTYGDLPFKNKVLLRGIYLFSTMAGLLIPIPLYKALNKFFYRIAKA